MKLLRTVKYGHIIYHCFCFFEQNSNFDVLFAHFRHLLDVIIKIFVFLIDHLFVFQNFFLLYKLLTSPFFIG